MKAAPPDAVAPESTDNHTEASTVEVTSTVEEEKKKEEIHLPEIVSVTESKVEETEKKTFNLPPLLDQLETLDFPESPNGSESSGNESKDDDETIAKTDDESEDHEDSEDTLVKLKLDNLPLPSILQYIRESESIASNYFSLQNKKSVDARLPVSAAAVGVNEVAPLEDSETGKHTEEENDTTAGQCGHEESTVVYTCDFCGSPTPQHSLLNRVNKEKEVSFQHNYNV